ncbi:cupin domain-containing protein [Chryseobacterium sp. CH21]|uniref:cupin domain-containing protein n=1 Tax=Chryseobacterium sp. CH21 TaxID=713556 RepID=UPI00100B0DEF|nr:cupin domain-containing protein [Chryseobacterium sp. CH21]RXM41430.1 cupin domain-containing protein [Chryseobacterium sp. CH21]
MKKNIISHPGDWSRWVAEIKLSLASAEGNKHIGDRIVFENNDFRIWQIHLPAGESLPFHKHENRYFWTVLTEGKAISYYNDGSIVESEYEIGDTKYFADLNEENYFIHNLENIGNTTLIFITVEFLN